MVPWKRFWILIIVGFTSASPAYFRQEHQRKQPQLRMKNQGGHLLATTTTGVFPTRTNTWQKMAELANYMTVTPETNLVRPTSARVDEAISLISPR